MILPYTYTSEIILGLKNGNFTVVDSDSLDIKSKWVEDEIDFKILDNFEKETRLTVAMDHYYFHLFDIYNGIGSSSFNNIFLNQLSQGAKDKISSYLKSACRKT